MKERYFSTFQLILLALFAGLIVAAKIALKTPLRLPGHSGLFWVALILIAARLVPRAGAASLTGLTSGILAAFLGMGDFGALETLVSYTAVGVGADLGLLLLRDTDNLFVCLLVGVLAHLGKFVVKWVVGLAIGAPLGFVALGLAASFASYVLFGALGGLLGWLTLRALRRAGFFAYLAERR